MTAPSHETGRSDGRAPAPSDEEGRGGAPVADRTEAAGAEAPAAASARRHGIGLIGRPRLAAGLGIAALVLAAWVGTAAATTQHIFSGSTAGSTQLGGMSASQARTAVERAYAPELTREVTVRAGKRTSTLVPAKAGVSVDAAATVARLTGFTLNPVTLAHRLTGAAVQPATAVDSAALRTALDARLSALSTGTRDASISITGTRAAVVPGRTGTGLDTSAAVARIASQGWPLGSRSISLPTGTAQPAITDAQAQALVDKTISPLLAAPVTVTGKGKQGTLSTEQLAGLLRVSSSSGALSAGLDPEGLRKAVVSALGGDIETASRSAGWTIDGDPDKAATAKPVYVSARTGTAVDGAATGKRILAVASRSGSARTAAAVIAASRPKATAPASSWGITEVIGEYTTDYFPDAARTQNLSAGTAAINGTLIPAGGTFSMTKALGPVDTAHGFTDAGVITSGQHSNAMGGGLSQVTTTTFNAAFEAGMDDVEHHPHQYWFKRYPAGREATLWTGVLDMKWRDPAKTAVLVQAWTGGGQVHVRLWGTKAYKVQIVSGEHTDYRPRTTVTRSGSQCTPYPGGAAGFDITVTRHRWVLATGKRLTDDILRTSYAADNRVVCK